MTRLVILVTAIAVCASGCYYNDEVLRCHNISFFPFINSTVKKSVREVIVLDSTLVELPEFTEDEWPSLEGVEFLHSLPCWNITCLEREGLAVVSDCQPPKTIDDWLMLAPITLTGFFLTSSVYVLQRAWRRYKSAVNTRISIRERNSEEGG
jgi:hypothetical protein